MSLLFASIPERVGPVVRLKPAAHRAFAWLFPGPRLIFPKCLHNSPPPFTQALCKHPFPVLCLWHLFILSPLPLLNFSSEPPHSPAQQHLLILFLLHKDVGP